MKTHEIAMNIYSSQTSLNPGSRQSERTNEKVDIGSTGLSAPAASDAKGRDTVTLTHTAGEVQKLEAQLASFPDVDSQRVAEIKAAIDDGSYQVDAGSIVDKLMSMDQALANG